MEKDFIEQAHDGVVIVIGEAVVQLVAEGRKISNEAVAEMIVQLSDGKPDLAVEFAIDMLER